jgi:hypothetical protein
MQVINVHQRLLAASPERAGALIDTLASPQDALWPRHSWPRMRLDRPLAVGAAGGHGPIGYRVEAYEPGHAVRFRFTRPAGFDGWHGIEVLDATASHCVLEHRLEMRTTGHALWTWPLVLRPLHDALVEDALTQAQASLGLPLHTRPWSARVRFLRWAMARRMPAAAPAPGERHAG